MTKIVFASERRSTARKAAIQKEMWRAQSFIKTHIPLASLYTADQANKYMGFFEKFEADIEAEATPCTIKKCCITVIETEYIIQPKL